MELRYRVDKIRKCWEDPTNVVQSMSMDFFRVQRTFSICSMLLLGVWDSGYTPRNFDFDNEIEFGSNFDWNVTLVLQATYMYIIYSYIY